MLSADTRVLRRRDRLAFDRRICPHEAGGDVHSTSSRACLQSRQSCSCGGVKNLLGSMNEFGGLKNESIRGQKPASKRVLARRSANTYLDAGLRPFLVSVFRAALMSFSRPVHSQRHRKLRKHDAPGAGVPCVRTWRRCGAQKA